MKLKDVVLFSDFGYIEVRKNTNMKAKFCFYTEGLEACQRLGFFDTLGSRRKNFGRFESFELVVDSHDENLLMLKYYSHLYCSLSIIAF